MDHTKGHEYEIDETLKRMWEETWKKAKETAEEVERTTQKKIKIVETTLKEFQEEQKRNWLDFSKAWKNVNGISTVLDKITGKK